MTYQAPGSYTPPAARGRNPILLIVAAVVVLGLLVGAFFVGRSTSSASDTATGPTTPATSSGSSAAPSGLNTPHGPAKFNDGIPFGYTKDKGGAATATMNALEAGNLVAVRKLSGAAVLARLAAPNASKDAREFLNPGAGSTKTTYFATVPLAAQTTALSATTATVRVWSVQLDRTEAGPGTDGSVQATYNTDVVGLTWAADDWKISTDQFSAGPFPGDAGTNPDKGGLVPWQGGQFTFFTG